MTPFSLPQTTIEAAQALHEDDLFNPAAIFETPEGRFVYGRIKETSIPPVETAEAIEKINGYRMVAYCTPLLNIWKTFVRS